MSSTVSRVLKFYFFSESIVIRGTVSTVLSLFLAQGCFAGTGPDCPGISKRLEAHGAVWDDLQPMRVGGVALCTAIFVSSLSAVELAQRFSAAPGIFDRVLSMPDQLVMSGVRKGWHWIAMIRTRDSVTSGYVSTMYTIGESGNITHSWLPPHVQSIFSHTENVDNRRIHQQGYQLRWPVEQVRAYIHAALTRQGWTHQPDADSVPGQSSWQRVRENLTILAFPDINATSLLVQHATQEASR